MRPFRPVSRFSGLWLLLAALPLRAAAELPAGTAPAAEAPAVPAAEAVAPAEAPTPPETSSATPPPAESPGPVEGTKLLFLRLNLRIKRIEQELMNPDAAPLVEHLTVAGDLLTQLRGRFLTDDEALRADRAEQYLQELMRDYAGRQAAVAPTASSDRRRR